MWTYHVAHKAPDATVHILAHIAFWSNVERLSNTGVNTGRFFTVMTDTGYGAGWRNKHTYVWGRGSFIRAKISDFLSTGNLTLAAEITLFRIKGNAFHIVKLSKGYSFNLGLTFITYSYIFCQTKMLVFLNFLTFWLMSTIMLKVKHNEYLGVQNNTSIRLL